MEKTPSSKAVIETYLLQNEHLQSFLHRLIVAPLLRLPPPPPQLATKAWSMSADNHTPLHYAVLNGDTAAMAQLLVNGASTEAIDDVNNTPLHHAAKSGYTGIVDLLLRKGAPIEAMGPNNDTALYFAASSGHIGIVELLLWKGASTKALNRSNQTPFDLARNSVIKENIAVHS